MQQQVHLAAYNQQQVAMGYQPGVPLAPTATTAAPVSAPVSATTTAYQNPVPAMAPPQTTQPTVLPGIVVYLC